MNIVLIIQARVGSSRLPGKMLMNLAGKPFLYRIIERIKLCSSISKIVIAIPSSSENDPLEEISKLLDVNCFRGSEGNVLDRFYMAAKKYKANYVLRFPGDNFAPEPKEIDRLVNFHLQENINGFSTNICNVFNSGYPDGIGAEMFSFKILENAWKGENTLEEREHVHLNFFNYESQKEKNSSCPVKTPICPKEIRRPELVLDVNTQEQLDYAQRLYNSLYSEKKAFGIEDIISWEEESIRHDNK